MVVQYPLDLQATSEQDPEISRDLIERPNEILRTVSYPREDFRRSVIRFDPPELPRRPIFRPFGPHFSSSDLTPIERLPLELLGNICLHLDLLSALRFSQASCRTRNALAQYRDLSDHAPDCLRALFKTGLANHTEITELHSVLCSSDCSVCGVWAGFLFLPTLARCCMTCLAFSQTQNMKLLPLSTVARQIGIPIHELKTKIPVVHTFPGTYSLDQVECRDRRTLVSVIQAWEFIHAQRIPIDSLGTPNSIASKDSDKWSYMATVPFPYLNPETGQADAGVSCKGCQIGVELGAGAGYRCQLQLRQQERMYARKDFLAHFEFHGEARAYWKLSQKGMVEVQTPSHTQFDGLPLRPVSPVQRSELFL